MTSRLDPSAMMIVGGDFTPCAQRTLKRLRRQFPGAFGEVRPLAIGIFSEVLSRAGMTGQEATVFFDFYTRSHAYLAACAQPDAWRVDLDGKPLGQVSEADRQYAAQRLTERLAERSGNARYLAFRAALLEPTIIPEEDQT